jgi:hypothetical protein
MQGHVTKGAQKMLQRMLTYQARLVYDSPIMSNIKDLTVAQLKRAIEIREEIESLQAQLTSIGGGRVGRPPATKSRKRRKRRMSAKGRARIAAAARARWAKYRRGATKAKPAKAGKKKRKRFSAAARAKLSAAAKARWAKAKASGRRAL